MFAFSKNNLKCIYIIIFYVTDRYQNVYKFYLFYRYTFLSEKTFFFFKKLKWNNKKIIHLQHKILSYLLRKLLHYVLESCYINFYITAELTGRKLELFRRENFIKGNLIKPFILNENLINISTIGNNFITGIIRIRFHCKNSFLKLNKLSKANTITNALVTKNLLNSLKCFENIKRNELKISSI